MNCRCQMTSDTRRSPRVALRTRVLGSIDGELDVQRRLQRVACQLTIALRGVAVTDEQQRTGAETGRYTVVPSRIWL